MNHFAFLDFKKLSLPICVKITQSSISPVNFPFSWWCNNNDVNTPISPSDQVILFLSSESWWSHNFCTHFFKQCYKLIMCLNTCCICTEEIVSWFVILYLHFYTFLLCYSLCIVHIAYFCMYWVFFCVFLLTLWPYTIPCASYLANTVGSQIFLKEVKNCVIIWTNFQYK